MQKLTKILLICLILTSCISEKKRMKICKTCTLRETKQDSLGEQQIITAPFDTALFLSGIKGKEIEVSNCDSLISLLNKKPLESKENGLKAIIERKGSGFVFRCEADSLKAVITLLKTKISQTKFTTITKEVPARCDLDHVSWWDNLFIWIGKILSGAFVLFLALKYFRKQLPI